MRDGGCGMQAERGLPLLRRQKGPRPLRAPTRLRAGGVGVSSQVGPSGARTEALCGARVLQPPLPPGPPLPPAPPVLCHAAAGRDGLGRDTGLPDTPGSTWHPPHCWGRGELRHEAGPHVPGPASPQLCGDSAGLLLGQVAAGGAWGLLQPLRGAVANLGGSPPRLEVGMSVQPRVWGTPQHQPLPSLTPAPAPLLPWTGEPGEGGWRGSMGGSGSSGPPGPPGRASRGQRRQRWDLQPRGGAGGSTRICEASRHSGNGGAGAAGMGGSGLRERGGRAAARLPQPTLWPRDGHCPAVGAPWHGAGCQQGRGVTLGVTRWLGGCGGPLVGPGTLRRGAGGGQMLQNHGWRSSISVAHRTHHPPHPPPTSAPSPSQSSPLHQPFVPRCHRVPLGWAGLGGSCTPRTPRLPPARLRHRGRGDRAGPRRCGISRLRQQPQLSPPPRAAAAPGAPPGP